MRELHRGRGARRPVRGATIVCLGLVLLGGAGAVAAPLDPRIEPPLPAVVPEPEWRELRGNLDPDLQAALAARLHAVPGWSALLRRRCLAVGVVDLSVIARPRFARLNGDEMMYAASLPKIGLLLAAMQGLEEGHLEDGPEVERDLQDMIRVSSNAAATRVFDRLGTDYIARVLMDPRWRLYDQRRGGLWVGKPYARRGPRVGDPLRGISHAATVTQTCRFYYLLATGRLISPDRSRRMLEVLADPALEHKLVRAIEHRSPGARLFRKSGTWRSWHADSILVWGPHWRRYILVVLVEDPAGEQIVQKILPAVEEVLQR